MMFLPIYEAEKRRKEANRHFRLSPVMAGEIPVNQGNSSGQSKAVNNEGIEKNELCVTNC